MLAKAFLEAELPGLPTVPAVTFGLALPDDWSPTGLPHLVVFDDTGGGSLPEVMTEPVLRVTVWSNSRVESMRIAGVAWAVLLNRRVTGIAQVKNGTSILWAVDSNNGGDMASFTVRTKVRTAVLQ